MRSCVIHIGTHKTGTTALQIVSRRHRTVLADCGVSYPVVGAPPDAPDGHHNIAWQISGDARFRPAHGTLDDLFAEVAEAPGDVVLSSEDFVCSTYHVERFEAFVDRFRGHGFAPRIVLYLRNQVDYCRSLYLELLKFGLTDPFDRFLHEIVTTGEYRWRQWIFPFCYHTLLSRLSSRPGVPIDVRSYDAPRHGSLVSDWLSIFGLTPAASGIDIMPDVNASADALTALRRFAGNHVDRPLEAHEDRLLQSLFDSEPPATLNVSEMTRWTLRQRFLDSNDAVVRAYPHLRAGLLDAPAGRAADRNRSVPLDTLLTAETVRVLSRAAHVWHEDDQARERIRQQAERERDIAAAERDRAIAEREAVRTELDRVLGSRTWRLASLLRPQASRVRPDVPSDTEPV